MPRTSSSSCATSPRPAIATSPTSALLAHIDEAGDERVYWGRCEGQLASEPRGEDGFGYDPAFVPDDTGSDDHRTMAELDPAAKHAISHRGRAARELAAALAGGS